MGHVRRFLGVLFIIVAVIGLVSCVYESSDIKRKDQALLEQSYENFTESVPYPADLLKFSVERSQLRERVLRFNQPNKIGYVYLLTYGNFIGYYTINGKVSSNQSQMTTDDSVDRRCFGPQHNSYCDSFVTTAPEDDGSFGENEQGIFFFTTEDVYVSTDLNYLFSDSPLAINVPRFNSSDGPTSIGESLETRNSRLR